VKFETIQVGTDVQISRSNCFEFVNRVAKRSAQMVDDPVETMEK
jgi:hypothetical protein